jgi:hypothetical protein
MFGKSGCSGDSSAYWSGRSAVPTDRAKNVRLGVSLVRGTGEAAVADSEGAGSVG